MDLHGAGIERMLEITADAGEHGMAVIDQLGGDNLVASLLLLYGLHPLDLETRVMRALDKVRPYLQSHGGNVELLERCELCAAELTAEHAHLLEPATRNLLCSCEACSVLFSGQADAKYRRVPRRIRFLTDFRMSDAQWDALMVPINMAFFFHSSPRQKVVALYPSPAGPTESLLPLDSWQDIVAATKYFGGLEDGEIPLEFLFSGTVFYESEEGLMQVAQISWEKEAKYRLPVRVWQEMMQHYYPNTAWLCLRKDVFDRLHRHKVRSGSTSWEQALESILPEIEESAKQ